MKLHLAVAAFICTGLFAFGCDHDHDHAAATQPAAAAEAKSDGHDHQHGHDHDAGPKEQLGLVEVEGFEVSVVQNGKYVPGRDVSFDVEILGSQKPAAVRFWLGSETATADQKRPPEQEKDRVYHVDLAIAPDAAAAGAARFWVEIDRAGGGEPVRASFDPVEAKP